MVDTGRDIRPDGICGAQGGPPIARHSITDSDSYTAAVKGAHVKAVQLDAGSDQTVIRTLSGRKIAATSGSARIPIAHYSSLPDDVVTVACIHAALPGSNWCGIDLAPGMILIYSPSVEHTGVDQAGLEFTFAVATLDQLHQSAERMELPLMVPERGRVKAIEGKHATGSVRHSFGTLAESLRFREAAAGGIEDDVVWAMVDVLATSTSTYRSADRSLWNSRLVARKCVDYAESIGRMPTTGELCLVAGVSERRLRSVFSAEFGISPARFFRMWALDKAHNRFVQSSNGDSAVTRVALDLGFYHLGRFSQYYRQIYGIAPSATLRANHPEIRDRDGLSAG